MSGVAINASSSARRYSESVVVPMLTADNLQNAEPPILASLSDMHHKQTKTGISFCIVFMVERKHLYSEAVDQVLTCSTGNLNTLKNFVRRNPAFSDLSRTLPYH